MNNCPVFQAADILGKKWTIFLVQEIALNGEKGFNSVLKRMRKISPKILSKRLKNLEENGIIEKQVLKSKSIIKTKYKLTAKGIELQDIVENLKAWNAKYSHQDFGCGKKECVNCSLY